MKIQLLSFPGCPNAQPALHALREAVALDKVGGAIEEIDVSRPDAPAWVKGWGSPTILIDDIDVTGETRSLSEASCRLYQGGAPSVAQIRARIAAARGSAVTPAPMRSRVPLIGGIAAALAASACCLVPAILAIVGVSGAGVASTLAPLRPYFLVATAIALGAGFWFAYRPSRAINDRDDCGCGTPKSRRWSRVGLWLSTVLIIGIAGYPLVFDATASVHGTARGVAEIKLHVTGMDCKACTKTLAKRLSRVPGVATVEVDYDHQLAVVTHDGKRDLGTELIAAVEDAGYEATAVR
jgi:mercuric ion transport protein